MTTTMSADTSAEMLPVPTGTGNAPTCGLCGLGPAARAARIHAGQNAESAAEELAVCRRCEPVLRRAAAWLGAAAPTISNNGGTAVFPTADVSERAAPAPHVETSSKPEPMPVQHRMTRLERDLAVIDAEWLTDQWGGREIIALAVRRLRPDGGGYARTWHFKPSGQVDDASRQVHGLTTEALGRAPAFEDCKSAVLESLKDADIGGYDVRNDVTLLEDALTAGGTSWPPTDVRLVDGLRIWQNAEPRSLAAGYRRFAGTAQAPQAHDPRNDAEMASAVIEALAPNLTAGQIENATDPGRLDPAGKLRRDENGQVVFNFGKHRGRRALDHSDFLFWMLKRDFTQSTRNVVLELLENGDPLEPPRATGERNDSDDDSLPF